MAKYRVLLVEDEEEIVKLLEMSTRDSQMFELVSVGSIDDALTTIHGVEALDGIILDPGLPDSDGMESVNAIAEARPDLPILLVTGDHDLIIPAAQQPNVCEALPKPFNPDKLFERMSGCIKEFLAKAEGGSIKDTITSTKDTIAELGKAMRQESPSLALTSKEKADVEHEVGRIIQDTAMWTDDARFVLIVKLQRAWKDSMLSKRDAVMM